MEQPFDFSQLGAMLQQLGAMMQRADALPEGAVDWDAARQAARAVISQAGNPSVVDAERERVRAAAALAHMWLDGATDFPAPTLHATAWSRSEWLEETFPAWQRLLDPMAQSMQQGIGAATQSPELPEEMRELLGPAVAMFGRLSSVLVAQQLGQALGTLAADAWSASDIGIPLLAQGNVALVTQNSRAFAESLDLDLRDLETLLALREAAAQRLFHAAPWIAPRLRDAIAAFAADARIDTGRMQDRFADVDFARPESLQEILSHGDFSLPMTSGQRAVLDRVETLLALIEGWIDTVVESAHGGRIGNAAAIREALRRRRASGGPAERTFAQLIGLELRPRRLREAATFWSLQPPAERDATWSHPDFLPDHLDPA